MEGKKLKSILLDKPNGCTAPGEISMKQINAEMRELATDFLQQTFPRDHSSWMRRVGTTIPAHAITSLSRSRMKVVFGLQRVSGIQKNAMKRTILPRLKTISLCSSAKLFTRFLKTKELHLDIQQDSKKLYLMHKQLMFIRGCPKIDVPCFMKKRFSCQVNIKAIDLVDFKDSRGAYQWSITLADIKRDWYRKEGTWRFEQRLIRDVLSTFHLGCRFQFAQRED